MLQILSKVLSILVILGISYVQSATVKKRECHDSLGEASLEYLASKRPYFHNATLEEQLQFIPEGCTPAKFWFFGRHGTRNPGDDDIILMQTVVPVVHSEILQAFEAGRGELCPDALAHFASWIPTPLNITEESYLVEQGRRELLQIGARYKSRFPNLFPAEFDNSTYFFKHTAKQRTLESAKAFQEGVFGIDGVENVWMPEPEDPDPILKFYEACPKWIEEVDENPAANQEHDTFVESAVMTNTISKVSQRVGLERNLTLEEITILFTTCAFETAWKNGTTSPWCVIFDLEDFKVMSFREDLEYYWKDGYGYEIDYTQACPPFKDAVEYFERYLDSPTTDTHKVQGYFSHSGANLKMLARLSLFLSFHMTSASYEAIKDVYTWRSSLIDTMASNMAFTLFSCPVDGVVEHKIGFYFQEIPQPFAGCGGNAFCSFEDFRTNVAPYIDTCNLEEICAV